MKRTILFALLIAVVVSIAPVAPTQAQDPDKSWGCHVYFVEHGVEIVLEGISLPAVRNGYREGFFHWPLHGHWYLGEVFQVNIAIPGRDNKYSYISFIIYSGHARG